MRGIVSYSDCKKIMKWIVFAVLIVGLSLCNACVNDPIIESEYVEPRFE